MGRDITRFRQFGNSIHVGAKSSHLVRSESGIPFNWLGGLNEAISRFLCSSALAYTALMIHGSLAWHKAEGFRIHATCNNIVRGVPCNHSAVLDWDVLITELGPDFIIVRNRDTFLRRLRCSKCGGRDMGIVLSPGTGYRG